MDPTVPEEQPSIEAPPPLQIDGTATTTLLSTTRPVSWTEWFCRLIGWNSKNEDEGDPFDQLQNNTLDELQKYQQLEMSYYSQMQQLAMERRRNGGEWGPTQRNEAIYAHRQWKLTCDAISHIQKSSLNHQHNRVQLDLLKHEAEARRLQQKAMKPLRNMGLLNQQKQKNALAESRRQNDALGDILENQIIMYTEMNNEAFADVDQRSEEAENSTEFEEEFAKIERQMINDTPSHTYHRNIHNHTITNNNNNNFIEMERERSKLFVPFGTAKKPKHSDKDKQDNEENKDTEEQKLSEEEILHRRVQSILRGGDNGKQRPNGLRRPATITTR